ncbi:MAG: glycerol kinase, partial [Cyanobacteria bacterium HKST-UBA02]|nr:glycerol kinase [Cyanobacteria bacterium HKST-UBA02]
MKNYLLSIDQGTTSCRAIVFNLEGQVIATGQKEFTQHFPKPGWVEHDAKEILRTQIECIKEAVAGAGDGRIKAVGITNQRETTVVWDRKTLEPVGNAIVWQCRRTAELSESLRKEPEFRERTGL